MREINFSIPAANKASVGITTALYDRRALDCTSTLPLVNSLNHLAYLTTSSARIRDILTVDGGVERLVCILKEGRSKDMMEMWKWNLAFQCVVNIGVRGSENVRTRVVEADMVPVIATILDNYIKVSEKTREKLEADMRRNNTRPGIPKPHRSSRHSEDRTRRQAPPPIDIPPAFTRSSPAAEPDATLPQFSLSSPPERTTFAGGTATTPHHHHHHHHHHRSHGRVRDFATGNGHHTINQPLLTAGPVLDNTRTFGAIPPVREVDRLPSMLPPLQAEMTSQPQSPTTPNAPAQLRPASPRRLGTPRRPSIRHQNSTSGDSDDNPTDEIGEPGEDEASDTATIRAEESVVTDIQMQDIVETEDPIDAEGTPVRIAASLAEGTDTPAFNLAAHNVEGSIANPATPQPATTFTTALPQVPINLLHAANTTPPSMTIPFFISRAHPYNFQANLIPPEVRDAVVAIAPREEDVLMSLQLLAYVSKYCSLRTYFQQSHLVPGLKVGRSLSLLDGQLPPSTDEVPLAFDEDPNNEFLLPEDFNIFPIVERFTVRHHSQDMQYWAGVVMRNLCRKDDSRGGIRQCAYYKCGKWEEYTRQFAKCRRCRRTKYCSKECQKSAWVYHRHWCVAAQ